MSERPLRMTPERRAALVRAAQAALVALSGPDPAVAVFYLAAALAELHRPSPR